MFVDCWHVCDDNRTDRQNLSNRRNKLFMNIYTQVYPAKNKRQDNVIQNLHQTRTYMQSDEGPFESFPANDEDKIIPRACHLK